MGSYIPNPPGTLPYKQPFADVFGQSMSMVANTLAQFYEQRRQRASQAADIQIKLMQSGLGGDPAQLIKSLKTAYDIKISPEMVSAMQTQAATRAELESQQQRAEIAKVQATAEMTQEQAAEMRQHREAMKGVVDAASGGDIRGLMRATTMARLAGVPGMKDFDPLSIVATEKLSDEQLDKLLAARQESEMLGMSPAETAQLNLRKQQLKLETDATKIDQAMKYGAQYGVDLGTAMVESQHPETAPPTRKPIGPELEKKAMKLQEQKLGLDWQKLKTDTALSQLELGIKLSSMQETKREKDEQLNILKSKVKQADTDRVLRAQIQGLATMIRAETTNKETRTQLEMRLAKALGITDVGIVHSWLFRTPSLEFSGEGAITAPPETDVDELLK